MDIYKLDDSDKPLEKFKITAIRQAVKNENRVNVFVDGKYSFSLDVSQVIDLKIQVGQEISSKELEELKKASEFGKLYQRTLEWTFARPRSEKEVGDYLSKKIYERKLDKDFIEKIIGRLKEKKLLNDEAFAKWYVENRFVKKGISRKRLKMELIKKGVLKEVIDEVLDLRNDEEELKKIIAKKHNKYTDEKLIQYLCRQGFDYQMVQSLVLNCEKD